MVSTLKLVQTFEATTSSTSSLQSYLSSSSSSSSLIKSIMSCCNGNCGCGSACKCGSGCTGCKMFPDFSEGSTTTETLIVGVAPKTLFFDGEMEVGAENGCKCGDNCSCNPCKCGK